MPALLLLRVDTLIGSSDSVDLGNGYLGPRRLLTRIEAASDRKTGGIEE